MSHTTRAFVMSLALAAATAAAAVAQGAGGSGTGDLGQQTQRAMQTAMDDLFNQGLGMPSSESLEEKVGKEKLDAFLANAVVKLTFNPDGVYKAVAKEGGEIVSFRLGKDELTPGADEEYDQGWLIRQGKFKMPRKAQKLSLDLKAGPTRVTVECHNKFAKSEDPVTFYVGPLDGLFCVGFTEADKAGADEVS